MTINLSAPERIIKNVELIRMLREPSMSIADRADNLIFNVCEHGIDFRDTVQEILDDADAGREFKIKAEAEGTSALKAERYLGSFQCPHGRLYAMVTNGQGQMCLPAEAEKIEQIKVGDGVLIDFKQERVVGLDGRAPIAGEVVSVAAKPADKPGHVIINYQGHRQLARLHHDLEREPDACQPGRELVYEPISQFALAPIDSASSGDELLVDLDTIAEVRREDVGCPKPVVSEIVERARHFIEHPDWIERMQVRARCSYLFVGGTGSGKSYHLKLIAREYHDLLEEFTGHRTSRLVIVDASQFWSPLFGETEQRITRWFDGFQRVASQPLRDRDGRELRAPIVVAMEECEALLRNRGESQGSSHLFDRPLALLLQKVESLDSTLNAPVFWILSTNKRELVDSAAMRRLGMRQVRFGSLRAAEAWAVLKTKIPDSMPIHTGDDRAPAGEGNDGNDGNEPRDALLQAVIGYLYGPTPKQAIAEVRLGNSERRLLNRSDVVTPAVLEEAVSAAVDRCLRKSHRAGRLLGLDAADIVGFLHRHFVSLARTLRPHNMADHASDWYERDRSTVVDVVPLADDIKNSPHFMGGVLAP
jgi:ATP-dependent 26S proteasome regulatory subunit